MTGIANQMPHIGRLLRQQGGLFALLAVVVAAAGLAISLVSLPASPARLSVSSTKPVDLLGPLSLVSRNPSDLSLFVGSADTPNSPSLVDHLYCSLVEFKNIGDKVLDWQTDVISPITISIDNEGQFISCGLSHYARELSAYHTGISEDRRNVEVSADFLRSGEVISLLLLHTAPELRISGRIFDHPPIGLSNRALASSRSRVSLSLLTGLSAMAASAGVLYALVTFRPHLNERSRLVRTLWGAPLFAFGYAMALGLGTGLWIRKDLESELVVLLIVGAAFATGILPVIPFLIAAQRTGQRRSEARKADEEGASSAESERQE